MTKICLIDQDDPAELAKVQRFAESFEHKVDKCDFPLYLVEKDGVMLGYFHLATVNVIHPAMKPGSTPREVYEMIQMVRERTAAMGHPVAVLVPQKTDFTGPMMETLGFYSTDNILYTDQPKT